MTTLRELTEEMQAVADLANDPDIPQEALIDTLEGIQGMFNEKAIKVVHVLVNSDSDIDAIDAEIARLSAKISFMCGVLPMTSSRPRSAVTFLTLSSACSEMNPLSSVKTIGVSPIRTS